MLVSESWLREFVKLDIDRETLLHQLTMAGLEVDGTEPAAADFSNVVVGEVVGLSQHPRCGSTQGLRSFGRRTGSASDCLRRP
jgi:hypothetical protein